MKTNKRSFPAICFTALIGIILLIIAATGSEPVAQMLIYAGFVVYILLVAGWLIYRAVQNAGGKVSNILPRRRKQQPESSQTEEDTIENDAEARNSARGNDISILIAHVSRRITEYLRSVYPNAAWDWMAENPGEIIVAGGTARIRTMNTDKFTHADVKIGTDASIHIDLLALTALGSLQAPAQETQPAVISSDSVTKMWYDMLGKQAINMICTEMMQRGHQWLYLTAKGEVLKVNPENKLEMYSSLQQIPQGFQLDILEKLMQSDGINVVADNGLLKYTFA